MQTQHLLPSASEGLGNHPNPEPQTRASRLSPATIIPPTISCFCVLKKHPEKGALRSPNEVEPDDYQDGQEDRQLRQDTDVVGGDEQTRGGDVGMSFFVIFHYRHEKHLEHKYVVYWECATF